MANLPRKRDTSMLEDIGQEVSRGLQADHAPSSETQKQVGCFENTTLKKDVNIQFYATRRSEVGQNLWGLSSKGLTP